MEILLQLALDPDHGGIPPEEEGFEARGSGPDDPTMPPPTPVTDGESLQADLARPLSTRDPSPFSLGSFLGDKPERFAFLEGKSLRSVLLDPSTPPSGLVRLKDLGKRFLAPVFPSRIQWLGRAIYFLSAASARVHHGEAISSLTAGDFRDGVRSLEKTRGLEPELAALCRAAERSMAQV